MRSIEFVDGDSGAIFHTAFAPDGGAWVMDLRATRRAAMQNLVPSTRILWRVVEDYPAGRSVSDAQPLPASLLGLTWLDVAVVQMPFVIEAVEVHHE